MKTHFYLLMIFAGLLFARENNIIERTSMVSDNSSDSQTAFRTGDYGLVCQNESGSYNTDMENIFILQRLIFQRVIRLV